MGRWRELKTPHEELLDLASNTCKAICVKCGKETGFDDCDNCGYLPQNVTLVVPALKQEAHSFSEVLSLWWSKSKSMSDLISKLKRADLYGGKVRKKNGRNKKRTGKTAKKARAGKAAKKRKGSNAAQSHDRKNAE